MIAMAESRNLTLLGPMELFEGGVGLVFEYPVFVANQTQLADFDYVLPYNQDCNVPVCWVQNGPGSSLGTRWWGATSGVISFESFQPAFQPLRDGGFGFLLSRPGLPIGLPTDSTTGEVIIYSSSRLPPRANSDIANARGTGLVGYLSGGRVITFVLSVPSSEWYLRVDAGDPASSIIWMGPLIALVLLAASGIALLAFFSLLKHHKHAELLRKMLPANVVRHLARGSRGFSELYDLATILFTDIVSRAVVLAPGATRPCLSLLILPDWLDEHGSSPGARRGGRPAQQPLPRL